MRLKKTNFHNLPISYSQQLEIDSVIKGTTNKIMNHKETRFIIPNLEKDIDIQVSLLRAQQECKEEVNYEISTKVPKSPPSCVRGDFASIEFLDHWYLHRLAKYIKRQNEVIRYNDDNFYSVLQFKLQ